MMIRKVNLPDAPALNPRHRLAASIKAGLYVLLAVTFGCSAIPPKTGTRISETQPSATPHTVQETSSIQQPPTPALPRTILPSAPPAASPPAPQPSLPQLQAPTPQPSEHLNPLTIPLDHQTIPIQSTRPTGALQDIFFDYDSSTIKPDALVTLRTTLTWLERHPTVTIIVEGHCDERGSSEYNLALGHRRATATVDYLIKAGISQHRITTYSYGKELPFALGHDESAWHLNRRAHFATRVSRPPRP